MKSSARVLENVHLNVDAHRRGVVAVLTKMSVVVACTFCRAWIAASCLFLDKEAALILP